MSRISTGIPSGRGASDTGDAAARDRATAFRRARRHSLLVKTLKVAFPVLVVGLLGAYGLLVSAKHFVPVRPGDNFDPGTFRPTKDGLAMENPRYEGFNDDGSKFLVTAKRAIPDFKQPDRVTLFEIDGTLTQPDAARTRLVATRGFYDNAKAELDLFERIDIVSETGLKAQLNSAKVFIKQNRIVSQTPVAAQMAAGTIRANAMELLTKKRQAIFSKGVAVRLEPKPPAPGKAPKPNADGLIGNSGAPIDIVARLLHIDDLAKIAIFKRGVRATQGEATLTSQELEVHYEGRTGPSAKPTKSDAAATDGARLKRIKALGQVVMIMADGRRATSDSAAFDTGAGKAVLAGNVVLTQGDSIVKGGHLVLDRNGDTALLTGDVRLLQGRNRLNGGRLFIDRKRGRSRLDRPAAAGRRAGRIDATFYQNKAGKGASKKGRKARSKKRSLAKARAAPVQFKTDPDAPIKITANELNIDDKAKSAIFKGDVLARQGDMTIRTVSLIATYEGSSALALNDPTLAGTDAKRFDAKAGARPKQPTRLTRVEARKKVLITTGDQSASGDWADFDLKANTALLGGNVVLKRGSVVILGEKLQIDMKTGRTRIIPRRGDITAATRGSKPGPAAAGPGGRPCPPGRTCLRLIPGEIEQRRLMQRGAPAAARRGAASGAGLSNSGKSKWRPSTSASSVIRAQ